MVGICLRIIIAINIIVIYNYIRLNEVLNNCIINTHFVLCVQRTCKSTLYIVLLFCDIIFLQKHITIIIQSAYVLLNSLALTLANSVVITKCSSNHGIQT